MNDIQEKEVSNCCWDPEQEASHMELCCCYVEMEDGIYDNACEAPVDECCC